MSKKNYTGLTSAEVERSREKYGTNVLTPTEKTPLWRLYLEKYEDPIIKILLVAAAISLVLAVIENEYIETLGIFIAILLATTVGFIFEMDAAKKFNVLTQLNEEQPVKVMRDGKVMEVKRCDVVVGDIVIIETGDEVPADGILHETMSLQIDESMLTGEPLTTKTPLPDSADGEAATESKEGDGAYPRYMVLRSSMVMNGRGVFEVKAVGDMTEIGHVARQSTEESDVKTPLNLQLDRLGSFINKAGFTLSALAGVAFLAHDMIVNTELWGPVWGTAEGAIDWIRIAETVLGYFMMAVTLIVMAVPEGLPMAVTLSLALNMRRMLKSNNLVRKLHACETMGAVTVICTDKTGTLTQNRMKVADQRIVAGDNLAEAIAVNSTAYIDNEGHGIGNPTEVALLLWLQQEGIDSASLRQSAQVVSQEPFSTETKKMTTTVMRNGSEVTYVKGAPEIVMAMCNMTPDEWKDIETTLLGYQQKAMRTIAVAERSGDAFHLMAVFGISDPVREEVPEAVSQCHKAGIKVKIVTGDIDATAMEIGRQIGITSDTEERQSISGAEFAALPDDEASELLKHICVMSRARPTDKQRMVQLLQKQGEVVAVTGDGTNDAPALNHAHVGLSLGSGTNVAKEASDMTLTDDSFSSIARAVMWGRSLYKNLQRFLFFQLVVNVAALLLVIAGSIIGTELPLTVTQILWVNLIMDTFAALALASLPPSREVMNEKPRRQTDFILTRPIIRGILLTGTAMFAVMFAFLYHCERGIDFLGAGANKAGVDVHELTLFFTTFVMLQWWNLFNAKAIGSRHSAFRRLWADKGLVLVLLLTLAGQWLIVTLGGEMFRCVPLSFTEWVSIILATSPIIIIGEIYRLWHTAQR